MKFIEIYSECSSIGPPGPIGGGAVIVSDGDVREIAQDLGDGSTHQAALMSIRMALNALKPDEMDDAMVTVWTSSKYATEVISGDWNPEQNLGLIQSIQDRIKEIGDVGVIYPGKHHTINEDHRKRAKKLAFEAIKHRK